MRVRRVSRTSVFSALLLSAVSAAASVSAAQRTDQTLVAGSTATIPNGHRVKADTTTLTGMLEVQNLRIEPPSADVVAPAAVLKFELLNAGVTPLTWITVEGRVCSRETRGRRSRAAGLARPFSIRGETVLEEGFTLDFEMLLRNLSPGCACAAHVEVVSARALTR